MPENEHSASPESFKQPLLSTTYGNNDSNILNTPGSLLMWSPRQSFDADASNDSGQYSRQSPFSSLFPQRLLNSAEITNDDASTSSEIPKASTSTSATATKETNVVLPAAKRFFCSTCNSGFTRRASLNKHVKNQHTMPQMKYCPHPQCSFITRNATALQSHKRSAHASGGKAAYFCRACSQRFVERRALLQHLSRQHRSDASLFGRANNNTTTQDRIEPPTVTSTQNIKPPGLSPTRPQTRATHYDAKNNTEMNKKSPSEESIKPSSKFDCDRCQFSAKSYRSLLAHRRAAHHTTRENHIRYHCAHCRRPFKTSTLLASHVKSVHKSRGRRTSMRSSASSGSKSHNAKQPPRATVTPLAVRMVSSTTPTPASSTEAQSLHSAIRHLNAANLSLLEQCTQTDATVDMLRDNVKQLLLAIHDAYDVPGLDVATIARLHGAAIDKALVDVISAISSQ